MHYSIKLTDEDLEEFNSMLPWYAGTKLPDGRIIGSLNARPGKRDAPQPIPDKRITRLHEAIDLRGKRVLEVGCFEGIHTIGLCGYGAIVTAVDVRPVNVVKTAVRLAAYGVSATVLPFDVEDEALDFPDFDVVFHCGVLYHLEEPVRHLERLLAHCQSMYLDTHVADELRSGSTLESGGRIFRGHYYREGGWADPFSGRGEGAFWLMKADLLGLFERAGFRTELWSERMERNGPRIGLFAARD
jgi:tRNA (mo5U34)-methyltransferase